jgi:hypothetical protein
MHIHYLIYVVIVIELCCDEMVTASANCKLCVYRICIGTMSQNLDFCDPFCMLVCLN